jgi:D-aminopeptidase
MTAASQEQRRRLRDLGIAIGRLPTGALNAITDVAGVRVGHATVWRDAPRLSRTGVTAIFPSDDPWTTELFAGTYSFNGCGEFTGWIWLEESGCLTSPICLTGTHSVGAVRDALINIAAERGHPEHWHLGLVGETYDGFLSDGYANAVQKAEVEQALDAATSGAVPEGCVGGGTGMNCHEFKGGIGTASRVVDTAGERYTVGVLVQANYGVREEFAIDGVPIGREIGVDIVPSLRRQAVSNAGSILIIVATDAPSCRINASAWRSAPPSAWPAPAATGATARAISSLPSRPATACRRRASTSSRSRCRGRRCRAACCRTRRSIPCSTPPPKRPRRRSPTRSAWRSPLPAARAASATRCRSTACRRCGASTGRRGRARTVCLKWTWDRVLRLAGR